MAFKTVVLSKKGIISDNVTKTIDEVVSLKRQISTLQNQLTNVNELLNAEKAKDEWDKDLFLDAQELTRVEAKNDNIGIDVLFKGHTVRIYVTKRGVCKTRHIKY